MGFTVEDQGAKKLRVVTKSDSTELRGVRALWIGGAGDVSIIAEGDALDQQPAGNGTAVVIAGVVAGTLLPISPRKVMSTSTTATSIVALY